MKILVIPDVHLKPWMFTRASEIMKKEKPDKAVCLMDIADDWRQELNLNLYEDTYDAAIRFAKEFQETLWCYGNHDLSYQWYCPESGFSSTARYLVCEKLHTLRLTIPDISQLAYVHKIDDVIFAHGGLADCYVRYWSGKYQDMDEVIYHINHLGQQEIWRDASPIWYRPQREPGSLYKETEYLHIVGHTPVKEIEQEGNMISCDVFSMYPDGQPIGSREYLLLDTVSHEWCGIK